MAKNPEEMLHPKLREAIKRLGYKHLLPVQAKSIDPVMKGYHTIIVAPTGSGKTEAALFPLLSLMLNSGASISGVKLVYITPLRALNRDLEIRISRLAGSVGFTAMVRHGDTTQTGRRRFLSEPPDIVITTPESLTLLLTVDRAKKALSSVKWVVIDEFHELVESKRGVELMLTLKKLEAVASRRLQKVALSATLSRRTLREAATMLAPNETVKIVEEGVTRELEYRLEVVDGSIGIDPSEGDSFWEKSVKRVAEIVKAEKGSVLIFTNTRATSEMLAASLTKELGFDVPAHHGSLSRHIREEAERRFREGSVKALVATSSLELGIDIGHVDLVIQFLSPRQVIAMTQRAGRSGHRLGKKSRAVIIVPRNLFEMMEAAIIAFRASKGHLEDIEPPVKPYDALAHFTVGAAIDGTPSLVDDVFQLAVSTYPYNTLTWDEFSSIIDLLEAVKLVKRDSRGSLKPGRRAKKYFYKTSMIPDERTYKAVDIVMGREVGEVSERFVLFKLMKTESQLVDKRPTIVLAGRLWRVLDIDPEKLKVTLSPVADGVASIPLWEGELIPVDHKVAREVCSIIELAMDDPDAARRVLKARGLSEDDVNYIVDLVARSVDAWGGSPKPRHIVVESLEGGAIVYVCLGSKGNFALALLLSKLLSGMGVETEFDFIPYAIVFRSLSNQRVGVYVKQAIERALSLDKGTRATMIYDALRNTTAYLIRFLHVAKRMGLIDPDAQLSLSSIEKIAEASKGGPVDIETLRELAHDKLDIKAMNDFLSSVEGVHLVESGKPSPLAMEVFNNPYLRSERGVNAKLIGIDVLIAAKKKALASKEVRMLCVRCLKSWTIRVGSIGYGERYKCPYCGSIALAPLPPGDRGDAMIKAFLKQRRGEKLSSEEKKLAREVSERATLYLTYSQARESRRVLEALSALGVGAKKAAKLLSDLQVLGEQEFYKGIIRAEEEYVAYRRFWSSSSRSSQ